MEVDQAAMEGGRSSVSKSSKNLFGASNFNERIAGGNQPTEVNRDSLQNGFSVAMDVFPAGPTLPLSTTGIPCFFDRTNSTFRPTNSARNVNPECRPRWCHGYTGWDASSAEGEIQGAMQSSSCPEGKRICGSQSTNPNIIYPKASRAPGTCQTHGKSHKWGGV